MLVFILKGRSFLNGYLKAKLGDFCNKVNMLLKDFKLFYLLFISARFNVTKIILYYKIISIFQLF